MEVRSLKSKSLGIVLCCILAFLTVSFTALTLLKVTDISESTPGIRTIYTLSPDTETDVINMELSSLVSNSVKRADFPEGILDSMKSAWAVNNKCAGRLTIPGTELDPLVVKGKDNDRYLKYNYYEAYTSEVSSIVYGNIFLDYRCPVDGSIAKNTVLHGHTTGKSDGRPKQSFRSLYEYRDKNHFIDCPMIYFTTLYGEYKFKICAVFYTTTQPAVDNNYFFNYIYPDMSDSNMVGYIDQVNQRKLYETGVSLEPTDKVITLSTCIYDYGKDIDTRLVVVGRLLHDGEDESVNPSLVKDNPDYRRPQRWYNNKGKTNPYKNAEKWTPSAE